MAQRLPFGQEQFYTVNQNIQATHLVSDQIQPQQPQQVQFQPQPQQQMAVPRAQARRNRAAQQQAMQAIAPQQIQQQQQQMGPQQLIQLQGPQQQQQQLAMQQQYQQQQLQQTRMVHGHGQQHIMMQQHAPMQISQARVQHTMSSMQPQPRGQMHIQQQMVMQQPRVQQQHRPLIQVQSGQQLTGQPQMQHIMMSQPQMQNMPRIRQMPQQAQPHSQVMSNQQMMPSQSMPQPRPVKQPGTNKRAAKSAAVTVNQIIQPTLSPAPVAVPSPIMVPSPGEPSLLSQQPRSHAPSSINSVPSPNIPLDTPQAIHTNSPQSQSLDNDIYNEKLKQLWKYVHPLKRTLDKFETDPSLKDKRKSVSKMKELYDILTLPEKRCSLDTLIKSEQVLASMDFGRLLNNSSHTSALPPAGMHHANASISNPKIVITEQMLRDPLLEAIEKNQSKPFFSHTLHRTFGPAIAALE